jgi:hypothetical protein
MTTPARSPKRSKPNRPRSNACGGPLPNRRSSSDCARSSSGCSAKANEGHSVWSPGFSRSDAVSPLISKCFEPPSRDNSSSSARRKLSTPKSARRERKATLSELRHPACLVKTPDDRRVVPLGLPSAIFLSQMFLSVIPQTGSANSTPGLSMKPAGSNRESIRWGWPIKDGI